MVNDNHSDANKVPPTPKPQELPISNNQMEENNMMTDSMIGSDESDIVNSSNGSVDNSDHDSMARTGVDLSSIIMVLVIMPIGLILIVVSRKLRH